MLLKYVNLGSGWRHRLFVLRDGVLRYYKVRPAAAAAARCRCRCRCGWHCVRAAPYAADAEADDHCDCRGSAALRAT